MEFTSKEARDQVLRNARRLRSVPDFESVYIHPDQTPVEREYTKKLTQDRNARNKELSDTDRQSFYYGIRNSQVVKLQVRQ